MQVSAVHVHVRASTCAPSPLTHSPTCPCSTLHPAVTRVLLRLLSCITVETASQYKDLNTLQFVFILNIQRFCLVFFFSLTNFISNSSATHDKIDPDHKRTMPGG